MLAAGCVGRTVREDPAPRVRKCASSHCVDFKVHLNVAFNILVLGLGWGLLVMCSFGSGGF